MRIGLDLRSLTVSPYSGMARQALALYETLRQREGTEAFAFTAAPLGHPHRNWAACPPYGTALAAVQSPTERYRFERRFLPPAISALAIDIYIATNNMGLPLGLSDVQRRRTKWVLQIHDVFQLNLRHRHRAAWREQLYQWGDHLGIRHAARLADAIWTPSASTAQAVADLLPEASRRIRVLPNAVPVEHWQHLQQEVFAPERFWLLVGSSAPRKNIPWFIEAWKQARAQWPDAIPDLVLIGHPQDVTEMPPHVRFVHGLNDAQLGSWYRLAERLWHPAYAEGFGLPVIEALACGTPVATATGSSLDEITPPASLRFDPRDTPALVRLMHDAATRGRGPGESPSELTAWARRYDLPAYAEHVDALIKELA
jgi:polysaccharide biosynthesis protein PslI